MFYVGNQLYYFRWRVISEKYFCMNFDEKGLQTILLVYILTLYKDRSFLRNMGLNLFVEKVLQDKYLQTVVNTRIMNFPYFVIIYSLYSSGVLFVPYIMYKTPLLIH